MKPVIFIASHKYSMLQQGNGHNVVRAVNTLPFRVMIFILLLVLVLGCVSNAPSENLTSVASTVPSSELLLAKAGDRVFVEYTGTFTNGTVFDSSVGKAPLEFDVGSGQMIKGFDAAVVGMKEGDEKTITLAPEDAYGLESDENIIEVPRENVPENVTAGMELFTPYGLTVRVVEVRNTTVLIDANHPLAGQTLVFTIKMVKIERE